MLGELNGGSECIRDFAADFSSAKLSPWILKWLLFKYQYQTVFTDDFL